MHKQAAIEPDVRAAPVAPSHSGVLKYGADPSCRPAIQSLARQVAGLLDAYAVTEVPAAVAALLTDHLGETDLLCETHRKGSAARYVSHLLYADPLRRFSIVALVWGPGQATPIHGHTAWGAMGVWQGELTVTNYRRCPAGAAPFECRQYSRHVASAGQVAATRPGISDLHTIANESAKSALSIHVYGRDLLADPTSLNIVLTH